MSRDAAIVTSWGVTVAGREAKALAVFMEFMQFIGERAAEGKCEPSEPYFATDGSGGFAIVRGKSDALLEISESEEYIRLLTKAQLHVNDLRAHWYHAGDEVMNQTQVFAQVLAEAGLS